MSKALDELRRRTRGMYGGVAEENKPKISNESLITRYIVRDDMPTLAIMHWDGRAITNLVLNVEQIDEVVQSLNNCKAHILGRRHGIVFDEASKFTEEQWRRVTGRTATNQSTEESNGRDNQPSDRSD